MELNDKIQLFENQRIRTTWDEKKSGIFFCRGCAGGIDQSVEPALYGEALESPQDAAKKERSELTINCSQLKMHPADGKRYKTDVADTE